jgi:hypothetical protein
MTKAGKNNTTKSKMKIGTEIKIVSIENEASKKSKEIFRFLKGHTFFVDDEDTSTITVIVTDEFHRIVWYRTNKINVKVVS